MIQTVRKFVSGISHIRNEKGSGANKMSPRLVSRIITGDMPASYSGLRTDIWHGPGAAKLR